MFSRFFNENENLDDIFNLDSAVVAPEYEYNSSSRNQFETTQPVQITNSIYEQPGDTNLPDNSVDSAMVLESESQTVTEAAVQSATLANLSFHSLLRRNLLNPTATSVNQNENLFSIPTQDDPKFSQFFGNTPRAANNLTNNDITEEQIDNTTIQSPLHPRDSNPNNPQSPFIEHNFVDERQETQHNFVLDFQPPNEHSQILFSSQQLFKQEENLCYVSSMQGLFGSYEPPEHIAPNLSTIPRSILNLYTQIKGSGLSDWAFVHALSAQTCQQFTPMDCYVMLKTSLLLSIASINAKNDRAPIPIISIGKDCSTADSIMNQIGNYAQRFLAPTDQIVNVSMNSDKFVEVGPVFLAKNGVCYLGNWSGLTKSVSEEIKIIIGSGRYFLDKNSENFQLSSAIWAHWSSTKSIQKDYLNISTFLKYFGLPIVMDSDPNDTMTDFILEEATNGQIEIPDDALNICYEDMKIYLNIIRKIEVKTSASAQLLLKSYSHAIRMDREDALSPRGSEIIQQMSESYAKMCLRDTVLVSDVVAIISIVEKTIREIIGLGGLPAPILQNVRMIEEVDDYMKNFEKWVYDYIGIFNETHT